MITGPRETIKRARKLRSEMSLPEVLLWREMQKRPGGFKFRRQHAAGHFILDFYCASVKLAIEVDGIAHDNATAAKKDEARSAFLRTQHVATLRIPATVVLNEIEVAVVRIVEVCKHRAEKLALLRPVPLHHPADGPPPRAGED